MIDAEKREMLRAHADLGRFVPIVDGGQVVTFVANRLVGDHAVSNPLSPEDFITGLEALGFGFTVHEIHPGEAVLLRSEPEWPLPASWEARARDLMEAFGTGRGREGIAFLRGRERAANP